MIAPYGHIKMQVQQPTHLSWSIMIMPSSTESAPMIHPRAQSGSLAMAAGNRKVDISFLFDADTRIDMHILQRFYHVCFR